MDSLYTIKNYQLKETVVLSVGINFGYMRVSTKEQNLERQYEALKGYVTDEK